jgi:ethanolamine utilization protein
MIDDALVRLITEAVMARLSSQEPLSFLPLEPVLTKQKKVLVLISNLPEAAELFWQKLGELDSAKVELVFAFNSKFKAAGILEKISLLQARYYELSLESLERLLPQAEIILLPYFSLSHLGKVANLIMDDEVSTAVLQGIWEGKQVLVHSELILQARQKAAWLPKLFLARVQEHFRTLQGLGVKLIELADLPAQISGLETVSAPAGKRTVITLEDIKAMQSSGLKRIMLSWGTIVTPLAKEYCKDQGIEIEFA